MPWATARGASVNREIITDIRMCVKLLANVLMTYAVNPRLVCISFAQSRIELQA